MINLSSFGTFCFLWESLESVQFLLLDKGFYKYDDKTQRKENDTEMEQIIRRVSQNAKSNIQIINDQVLQLLTRNFS